MPVGGPTAGGTAITVLGSGFLSFGGDASAARCKFDYLGVLTVGPVTSINSDGELVCTVPQARFSGETSVKVRLRLGTGLGSGCGQGWGQGWGQGFDGPRRVVGARAL